MSKYRVFRDTIRHKTKVDRSRESMVLDPERIVLSGESRNTSPRPGDFRLSS